MIKIFYLTMCPYSQKAVTTIRNLSIPAEEIIADNIKDQVIAENKNITGNYTKFPQIFYSENNYFVGGYSDLDDVITSLRSGDIPRSKSHRKDALRFYTFLSNYI